MRKIALLTLVLLLAACGRSPAPTGNEPTLDTLAATITVNTTVDELDNVIPNGKCSLREAIIAANNNSDFGGCTHTGTYGTDTISIPAGTFTLTRTDGFGCIDQDCGDLNILSSMTLDGAGPGSTIIRILSASTIDRLIRVGHCCLGGRVVSPTATIKDVTLRGTGDFSEALMSERGKTRLENSIVEDSTSYGIFNSSELTIVKSIIRNNHNSFNNINSGGGINNSGTLIILDSTLSGNTTKTQGGGIYQLSGSTTITNSTISGNSAISDNGTASTGGGIYLKGGTINITNSTITNNTAGQFVGGIFRETGAGAFTLRNTIVAGNTAPALQDCSGAFSSGGNNLMGIVSGACTGFSSTLSDQRGTETSPLNPQLGPLANNGGFTPTHALVRGSTAIDRGNSSVCTALDQRGVARFDGNNDGLTFCDIGALEYNTPFSGDLRVRLDDNPGSVVTNGNFSYIMTLSNVGPDRVAAVKGELSVHSSVTVLSPLPSGCLLSGSKVTCSVGIINSGASVTRIISVRAPSTIPSGNVVVSVATATSSTPDPVTPNRSIETTTVTSPPIADLSLGLVSSASIIGVGETFTYALTVSNNGPNAASNIVLTQTLPSHVSFQSATANCSHTLSIVTCTTSSLPSVGVSSTSIISVIANAAGTATSTATITSSTPADPNTANNNASSTVSVNLLPTDLSVAIVAPTNNANVPRNTDLAYDIRVRNNNATTATAKNIVLTITFPNTVSNIRVPATCSLSGLVATCNIETIDAATVRARSITVRLPNTATTVSVTASVTLANPDPNTANNQFIRNVNVQ